MMRRGMLFKLRNISANLLNLPKPVRGGIGFHHLGTMSGVRGTSSPANLYEPDVGLSKAAMQFSRVVLPEPDGPRRIIRSPSLTSILTPSSALTVPETIS